MNSPLNRWLGTQPKEFVDEIDRDSMYGDSYMSIEKLRELDIKYNNLEGESNDSSRTD